MFWCFSLSFCSSSPASQRHSHCGQMRPRVLFLTLLSLALHAGATHAFELCGISSFCRMRIRLLFPPLRYVSSAEKVSSSLVAVQSLSAECGRFCCPGFVRRCLRACLGGVVTLSHHLLSHARRLEICHSTPGDFAAVSSRSGIGMFWTLLRVLSWVICASHGTYVVPTVFWATLISVEEFPACPYFIWDTSCVELERQILRLLSL